ncbi:MAG: Fe-S protein assembly co-chaperone HscB [bacterium]
MDLTSDYFDIFDVPRSFSVDIDTLSENYRQLQKQFHPDRFAAQSAQQKRIAEQTIGQINQGFQTLKSPLRRAQYLLSLAGIDSSHENMTHQDMDFLMEQMTLREALSEVRSAGDHFAALDELAGSCDRKAAEIEEEFKTAYESNALRQAQAAVAKMQFFAKLRQEINELEDELD